MGDGGDDGLIEGAIVGQKDGEAVGNIEGLVVGLNDGEEDGLVDGANVGDIVGLIVGAQGSVPKFGICEDVRALEVEKSL
mmetsp:Transcript_25066/g.40254  ORF Transcript_25066/g.40254 Transcript_25066/m.40254 type:complete len:80 (+) Transcript_25066:468-707(+)